MDKDVIFVGFGKKTLEGVSDLLIVGEWVQSQYIEFLIYSNSESHFYLKSFSNKSTFLNKGSNLVLI